MTLTKLHELINNHLLERGAFYVFSYTNELNTLAKAKKDGVIITRTKIFSARICKYTNMKVNKGREYFNPLKGEKIDDIATMYNNKVRILLQENPNSKTTTTYYLNGVETTYAALIEMGYVSKAKRKNWAVAWKEISEVEEHVKSFLTEQEAIDWINANKNSNEIKIISSEPYFNLTREVILDGLTLIRKSDKQ